MIITRLVMGSLASLGLALGIVAGGAIAQMNHEMPASEISPSSQFRRIEQPLWLKGVVTTGGVVLIGLEVWWFLLSRPRSQKAQTNQGVQEITVTVDGGYEPSRVVVNAGQPVRLNFLRRDPSSCLEEVRLPDFHISQALPLNQLTPIEFNPDQPGTYEFTCGMNMFRGAIEVQPIDSKSVTAMISKPTRKQIMVGLVLFGTLGLGGAFALDYAFSSKDQMNMDGHLKHDIPTDNSMSGMNHGGSMDGGHDMSPVDVSNAPIADLNAYGNQPLEPKIVDGIKEFTLTTGIVQWPILLHVKVGAYAYNNQVPGPLIRVNAGDRIRINVNNGLAEPTSIHWHGLTLSNSQDGVANLTQPPIQPGETFTYEYPVPDTPGTYFYHTHHAADRQQPLGLYGALIIDDPSAPTNAGYDSEYVIEMGEWKVMNGQTFSAMEFDGMLPNYFTINGKSYPETETINAKVGDRILLRFIGTGQFAHPMHVHGGPFEIVATDGNPVKPSARWTKDTILVGPGERYDVIWQARQPGKWLIHCHINHHTTNDGAEQQGGGGMTMLINIS
jgi:plastocyanin domain-containing protein